MKFVGLSRWYKGPPLRDPSHRTKSIKSQTFIQQPNVAFNVYRLSVYYRLLPFFLFLLITVIQLTPHPAGISFTTFRPLFLDSFAAYAITVANTT